LTDILNILVKTIQKSLKNIPSKVKNGRFWPISHK